MTKTRTKSRTIKHVNGDIIVRKLPTLGGITVRIQMWDVIRGDTRLGQIRRHGNLFTPIAHVGLPSKGTINDAAELLRRHADGEY
jgi:hypothetical protein